MLKVTVKVTAPSTEPLRTVHEAHFEFNFEEATGGFEPPIAVLQMATTLRAQGYGGASPD